MQNRIGQTTTSRTDSTQADQALRRVTATPTATVIPMPGRLPVAYFSRSQRRAINDVPLDRVDTGTLVSASGTITAVKHLNGGRAMAVISDTDGHSAHVLLNADVVRMVAPALYRGYRLDVRGTVIRTNATQPAGIDGRGVKVEVA